MKTSDQIDKIAPAMLKAHSGMAAVSKGGFNKFDKYTYAKLEDYYSASKEYMHENGLFVIESCEEFTPESGRVTSQGNPNQAVHIKTSLRVTHTSGQWMEIQSLGEGQDRADKSMYKAITGSRKYAIAMMFNLATTDDPEADEKVGTEPGPKSTPPKANDNTHANQDLGDLL